MTSFDPEFLLDINSITDVTYQVFEYSNPTDGFMDLSNKGELVIDDQIVSIIVYAIEAEIDNDTAVKMTIEEYPLEGPSYYISDLFVDSDYRDNGLGTEILRHLCIRTPATIYIYTSSEPMKHIVNKLNFNSIDYNWYKRSM